MLNEEEKKILAMPAFRDLVRRRKLLGFSLTAAMVLGYLALALLSSNAPEIMSTPVITGGTFPVGILFGYCLIFSAVICAAVYTKISNAKFEKYLKTIRGEINK